jgi:hypothetical protein
MTITSSSEGSIKICVVDNSDSTSNAFEIVVPGTCDSENFTFVMNIGNLKLISGTYEVEVSSRLISRFTNSANKVSYFIALEKSSTYGA